MSRQPPIPPASQPVHGPDGVPKTSVDITHRVRHAAERVHREADEAEDRQGEQSRWILALACAAAFGAVVALTKARRRAA